MGLDCLPGVVKGQPLHLPCASKVTPGSTTTPYSKTLGPVLDCPEEGTPAGVQVNLDEPFKATLFFLGAPTGQAELKPLVGRTPPNCLLPEAPHSAAQCGGCPPKKGSKGSWKPELRRGFKTARGELVGRALPLPSQGANHVPAQGVEGEFRVVGAQPKHDGLGPFLVVAFSSQTFLPVDAGTETMGF